jgi:hypothetical protein
MAAVAYIAITKYSLRLKGGFIRDWVVGGEEKHPSIPPDDEAFWGVTVNKKNFGRPDFNSEFIPQDLDFQMRGSKQWFDVMRFANDVESLGIPVTRVHEDALLTVIVFDAVKGSFGPFTAEFAARHIAPCMVDIDFDCNNLCLEQDYPKDLCMRIPHPALDLPQVVKRIVRKELYVCKHRDEGMKERVNKMEKRGWHVLGDKIWVPGSTQDVSKLPIHELPKEILDELRSDIPGIQIVRVFKLVNEPFEALYTGEKNNMRLRLKKEGQLNERFAWHGAPNQEDVKEGIALLGLDHRFWTSGQFGRGGYLAAHPRKSHYFCKANQTRLMFYFKVLLGNIEYLDGEASGHWEPHDRYAPNKGFDSICGKGHAPDTDVDEYVIFQRQQALPLYQIEYTGGF